MKKLFYYLFLFIAASMISCTSKNNIQSNFKDRYSQISNKYIPDKTLGINEISLKKNSNDLIVHGKTSDNDLFYDLKQYSDSMAFNFQVTLLPDSLLKDSIFGIINVSVTPIREKPKHSSQMVDQAILGKYVRLFEKVDDWYLCQTDYDYVGWINKSAIHRCDSIYLKTWIKNASFKINKLTSSIYSAQNEQSIPISDVVLNNRIVLKQQLKSWTRVMLPDGREGFVKNEDFEQIVAQSSSITFIDNILSIANRMTGIPYLWGGNSSKGNDCSGFTQTVFDAAGYQLPRDARQQAKLGIDININDAKPGDLLFFGDGQKVTHVGISLGKMDFIHQGGKVDVHSLDTTSDRYNDYRKQAFMFTKRITLKSGY